MATRDPKAKPIPMRELIARLEAIDAAHGLERWRLARELSKSNVVEVTMGHEGDVGIWQATRPRGQLTYQEVLRETGYAALTRISDAVSRVNRRRRGEL